MRAPSRSALPATSAFAFLRFRRRRRAWFSLIEPCFPLLPTLLPLERPGQSNRVFSKMAMSCPRCNLSPSSTRISRIFPLTGETTLPALSRSRCRRRRNHFKIRMRLDGIHRISYSMQTRLRTSVTTASRTMRNIRLHAVNVSVS